MPKVLGSNPKSDLSNLKVAVLCGGDSSEAKISLKSGRAIHRALKKRGAKSFLLNPAKKKAWKKALKSADIAFVALHGAGGEDGKIQSVLEQMKLPYVGSSVRACERSFDKFITKRYLKRHRVRTPDWKRVQKGGWRRQLRAMKPLFLKPPCDGSSLGILLVEDLEKSAVKIGKAFSRDSVLMAESRIEGREFTVGVLGEKALPVIELRPKRSFYDYRAKYTKGMTRYLAPAPIPKRLAQKMQTLALRTHRALGMQDMSRVDMMMDEDENIFVLEINAIPGFTELSLLPMAARKIGLSFEDLCEFLIHRAYKRFYRRKYAKT